MLVLQRRPRHSPSRPNFVSYSNSARGERRQKRTSAAADGNYGIINPGGGWPTKFWSPSGWPLADLLWSNFGIPSLVTYGPGGVAWPSLKNLRSGKAAPVSLSLKGFYSLAKQGPSLCWRRTGPTHIAVAASAPFVGLFGPTEWWRNGSPHTRDICIERIEIDCRVDCHRRSCSNWICMDIAVDRVLQGCCRI